MKIIGKPRLMQAYFTTPDTTVLILLDLLTLNTSALHEVLSGFSELPISFGQFGEEGNILCSSTRFLKRQVSQRQWSPTSAWRTIRRVSILCEMCLCRWAIMVDNQISLFTCWRQQIITEKSMDLEACKPSKHCYCYVLTLVRSPNRSKPVSSSLK